MKGVAVVLYDEDKKILLQYRTADAPKYPNFWSFFGGRVEENETPEEGIIRETLEEINYPIPINELKFFLKKEQSDGMRYLFIAPCKNKSVLKLFEGEKMEWFPISEIKNLKMPPWQKEEIDKIEQFLKEL